MSYEAVFFDLDDTLYSYPECNEAGKDAAWREARDLGYDLSREAFDDLYMAGRREVKRELAGTASAHERFLYFKRALELHTGTHNAKDALALGEAYWGTYVEEMELFDGVRETLETLQDEGIDVAIVSNLTTRIQLEKIDHLGIGEYVDLVLTSEETGREKPGSVMFALPLARLDRRPSEAVMVGDDVEADVEGGNAIGLTTVLFNGEVDEEVDTEADARAGTEADAQADIEADAQADIEADAQTDPKADAQADTEAGGEAANRRPDHQIDAFGEVLEVVL